MLMFTSHVIAVTDTVLSYGCHCLPCCHHCHGLWQLLFVADISVAVIV